MSRRTGNTLYKKARELGIPEFSIKQLARFYQEEFFRYPTTIGDILEVLE